MTDDPRVERAQDVYGTMLTGWASWNAAQNALRDLLAAYDELLERAQREADDLRALVKEWLCERCNYVYPGPPQPGFLCVICPRCGGSTMPRPSVELRKARELAQRDREDAERYRHCRNRQTAAWVGLDPNREDEDQLMRELDAIIDAARKEDAK